MLALLSMGVLLGGPSGLLAYWLTGLGARGDLPIFAALAVGIPIFTLVLAVPLTWLAGLREVFLSSTWTLGYAALRRTETQASQPAPRLDAPGLEAASSA